MSIQKSHIDGVCDQTELAELKRIQQAVEQMSNAESFTDMLRLALSYMEGRWGVEGLGVQLIDPTEELLLSFQLVCVEAFRHQEFSKPHDPVRITKGSSRSAEVISSGRRYYAVVEDVETHPFLSEADREVSKLFNIKDNLILPIFHQGIAYAVLHIGSYGKHLYLKDEQLDQIEAFCRNLKGYLVAAQRNHLLKLQRDQAAATNRLVENLGEATELDDVLNLVGKRIQGWGTLDGFSINLLDPESGDLIIRHLKLPAGYQAIEKTYLGYVIHIQEDDPNVEAIEQNQVLVLGEESIQRYTGSSKLRFERWGLKYLTVMPVVTKLGQCLGSIMLFSQKLEIPKGVVDALQHDLRLFSRHIERALTLHHYEAHALEIQTAVQRQRRFLDFVIQLSEMHDKKKLVNTFLEGILRHFPQYQLAVMHLERGFRLEFENGITLDPRFNDVITRSNEFLEKQYYELSREDGAVPTCFLQNVVIYFESIASIRHLPMAQKDVDYIAAIPELVSIMQMPLRHRGQTIGVLGLGSLEEVVPEAENDRAMIELICAYVGAPLFNAAMYEKVESQNLKIEQLNRELMGQVNRLNTLASKDELTGLDNVRQLRNDIKNLMPVNGRMPDKSFSLIMIDVDHFKDVNDEYGHIVGDAILKLVGRRLSDAARGMDSVYRYGGEEFSVVLPRTSLDNALEVAERLRIRLNSTPFVQEGISHQISASFGVAEYAMGEKIDELISRADQKLYLAKKAGRDCVRS